MSEEVRVGARPWQILGAIAQMPDELIHKKDLYAHIRRHSGVLGTRHILDTLLDAGLITESKEEDTIRLTEKGATAKRTTAYRQISYFCPVSRRMLVAAGY